MKYYHFKTVCKAGRTHTCNVSALNYHEAKNQAHEIFSTYYPEHGWVVYMSYKEYAIFNNIPLEVNN